MIPRPTVLRLSVGPDLGDVMRLAAAENPFLPQEEVLDRVVLTDRIGLLVGGNTSMVTLLYLWTRTIDDVLPWMTHASQWLERYPIWRKAHGLALSSEPVRMVLAAPGLGDGVRSALRLISGHVTPVRYSYLAFAGRAVLGWESENEAPVPVADGSAPATHPRASLETASIADALTPEELAFFRNG